MSKRITTVTLNAAIDKTYFLNSFELGATNRVSRMIAQPGGKGMNSARVIRALGEEVMASGVVGGNNGAYIKEALTDQGIPHHMLEIEGESRLCLNIIDESSGVYSEILESGPTLDEQACAALVEMIKDLATDSSVVTLSGSLPAGAPVDLYNRLIEVVQAQGALALLDTSGAALASGIEQKPFMIKPNEDELKALLKLQGEANPSTRQDSTNEPYSQEQQVVHFIRETMLQKELPCVAVTLGEKGALVGYEETIYQISPVSIEAINPVGSGDSFIAGMAVGLHRGLDKIETLKLASACGASNAMHQAAGMIDLEQVERFMRQIEVTEVATIK